MAEVHAVIHEKHYSTYIQAGTNSLIADEGLDNGGQGEGFNPEELLAASLSACTSITLRMYADRKAYKVEEIEVNVKLSRDADTGIATMERAITVHGEFTAEEKARLLQIANSCPVHKILTNQINIKTELL